MYIQETIESSVYYFIFIYWSVDTRYRSTDAKYKYNQIHFLNYGILEGNFGIFDSAAVYAKFLSSNYTFLLEYLS